MLIGLFKLIANNVMTLIHRLQALLVITIWGLDFVVAKVVLQHFEPFFLLTLRFGVAAALLMPFIRKVPAPIYKIVAIAFVFSVVHAGLIHLALRLGLAASASAIAMQMRVPLALIMSVIFLHEIIRWRSITGIVLSITGTLILVGSPNVLEHYWAFLAALGGALGWAVYNTMAKQMPHIEYFNLLGWISIISTPVLFSISFLFEEVPLENMPDIPWLVFVGMIYLVSFSTILSQYLWYGILREYNVEQVAPYTLMIPVTGVLAAIVFLGESVSWPGIAGGLLTLAGVGIIIWRRPTIAEPAKQK